MYLTDIIFISHVIVGKIHSETFFMINVNDIPLGFEIRTSQTIFQTIRCNHEKR